MSTAMTPATLIGRKNRFTAMVDLDGKLTDVHIPSSGRLGELIVRGHRVMLRPAGAPKRITEWDLVLIEYAGMRASGLPPVRTENPLNVRSLKRRHLLFRR